MSDSPRSRNTRALSRRKLLQSAVVAGGLLARAPRAARAEDPAGPFTLPALPYKEDALAPHISAKTVGLHYGKHHKGYVTKLNALVKDKAPQDADLVRLMKATHADAASKAVFNNAAQIWNHDFFWKSMKPGGGGKATGKLAERLQADLGGHDGFVKAFTEAAVGHFGSGYAWLVLEGDKLRIVTTPNAECPLVTGAKPLLTLDVWEHAYYVDYENRRVEFVKAYLEHLVNWEFALANLG